MIDSMLSQLGGSGVKMATGSYVGNGAYGPDNPNTLTFEFEPQIVFLYENGNGSASGTQTVLFRNSTVYSYNFGTTRDGSVIFDDKTVTWFAAANYPNAAKQYNESGLTYTYLAIG